MLDNRLKKIAGLVSGEGIVVTNYGNTYRIENNNTVGTGIVTHDTVRISITDVNTKQTVYLNIIIARS